VEEFDVVVIGGGPGGYPASISCARHGMKVCLIEEKALGGVCLNQGCIPTKALVQIARKVQPFSAMGINSTSSFSWEKILDSLEKEVILRLRAGISFLLKANGVQVKPGTGIFLEPGRVEVNGQLIKTKNIILATGSKPLVPALFQGEERILTSDDIWSLKKLPERLAIIGGGVIGCELACIFSSFGVRVTIYEMCPHLLPGQDEEIVSLLEKSLQEKGIQVKTGKKIESTEEIPEEVILLAIGRTANLSDLADRGLAVENNGIKVDNQLRTNLDKVYAAGDVNGIYQYAYVATREGLVAASSITGKQETMDYHCLPVSIFTQPEIGSCGLTENQARTSNIAVKIGRFPFSSLGRAQAERKTTGLVKVVAEAGTLKISGIHIIGEAATELVALATVIVKLGLKINDVEKILFCHPTFAEAVMEAVSDTVGQSIHLPPRRHGQ